MTTPDVPINILSLRFEAENLATNRKFQLNRKRLCDLGHIVITTSEEERSVTLFCDGLTTTRTGLDLLEALRSGLFKLVESGKDNASVIKPPAAATPSQMGKCNVPPRSSPQRRQVSFDILTDTTHAAWKDVLQPGQTYGLRLSKDNGQVYACYTDELDDLSEDGSSAQKHPVGREGDTYYFSVHDDPAPPRIFARLEMPHQAHLTGPIPFTFIIEYTTNSLEPFVIDKSRTPVSVFEQDLKSIGQLIDCRDNDTGEKVSWGAAFICYDYDPHPLFPDDDDFIEISADKPWRFECTLGNLDNEEEYVRSMEGLEAGRTYRAQFAGHRDFGRWQYGRKVDLLSGSREEKMKRWDVDMEKLGYLDIEMLGEDVYFETVA